MHNVVHAVAFSYHSSMYVQYVLTFICFSNLCTNISPKSSGLSQAAIPIVQSVQGPKWPSLWDRDAVNVASVFRVHMEVCNSY